MAKRGPGAADVVLLSHVAVDYVHGQGLGIGIVQQAMREQTERNHRTRSSCANTKQKKIGIKRQDFTAKNVNTAGRAHMLGLLHALGLARKSISIHEPSCAPVGSIRVMFASRKAAAAVRMVKHHIENAPESLEDVVSPNDRMMIKRVIKAVRKLAKRVPPVSIEVGASKDPAAAKAARLAKQKGTKACRSRRLAHLAQESTGTALEEKPKVRAASGGAPSVSNFGEEIDKPRKACSAAISVL